MLAAEPRTSSPDRLPTLPSLPLASAAGCRYPPASATPGTAAVSSRSWTNRGGPSLLPKRNNRNDEQHPAFTDSERHLILAAETLRSGERPGKPLVKDDKSAEEKISLFWRVFGGTILSICALVIITAYQSLANGIHELRGDVGRLRETSGEYI